MQFEWDQDKARANFTKHGVDFETAKNVFRDPGALMEADDDQDEERWHIVGLADSRVLFVVFVERDDDVIRIISARKANKREERDYFDQKAP